ncbi:hypothetical protein GCK72_001893 [Caenorhabditis remanei]|uniref:Uncharacterized protein n=1 Tax=Caenorhabditis remanei TaxID=31234 RepID=A0A6A5HR43_CAERE|nr:hypothetical protein GCK72_001893 [Caenorhabditis remanei]KAF1770075.1 hypothetical protein GCK72_001893 [Caenorhabditis remanei]
MRPRSKPLPGRLPPLPIADVSPISGRSGKSDTAAPAVRIGSKIKHNRLRKTSSCDRNNLRNSGQEEVKKNRKKGSKERKSGSEHERVRKVKSRESAEKSKDYDGVVTSPYDKVALSEFEKKYKNDYEEMRKGKKDEKKELRQSQIGSVFEPIMGPTAPARSGANGVKNKMKWKIDVDPIELRGEQKMAEILEKLKELRKSSGSKPCKVLKANEQMLSSSDDEPTEELIHMSARILQLVKMDLLISKEISKEEQEYLKSYCRCGDHKERVEPIFETIACSILEKVASKNEFIRHVSIPGQLRIFAVDEKKSKYPIMSLMIIRKDLFYYSWNRQTSPEDDEQLDPTWNSMTVKGYTGIGFVSSSHLPPQPAPIKSAHFQLY